jgi:hypothetical protein
MSSNRRVILAAVVLSALVLAATAAAFDCRRPPFGQPLEQLDQDGRFQPHREKYGISYYLYNGACPLIDNRYNRPVVIFGFIDDRLFCRILQGAFNFPDQHPEEDLIRLAKKRFGADPDEYRDHGWRVLTWDLPKEQVTYKLKYHSATGKYKSVFYYQPLRKHLKDEQILTGPE